MSREIKFRAWSTRNGGTMYPLTPAMNNFASSDLCSSKGWHVMQYTGLKDKNGVEIYESDIVEYKFSGSFSHEGIGIIQNENGCFHVNTFLLWDYGIDPKDWHIEVIGNFHQTPELLK